MHPAPDPPRGREPLGNMTGGCKEASRQPSTFIGLVDMFGLCPRYRSQPREIFAAMQHCHLFLVFHKGMVPTEIRERKDYTKDKTSNYNADSPFY